MTNRDITHIKGRNGIPYKDEDMQNHLRQDAKRRTTGRQNEEKGDNIIPFIVALAVALIIGNAVLILM